MGGFLAALFLRSNCGYKYYLYTLYFLYNYTSLCTQSVEC